MNVVLRKEDGSTSVLLFVYNMIYSKTSGSSLRLASLLEIMGAFGKAESAARMSLSRACKAGLLESSKQGKDVVYSITPQAREGIEIWNTGATGFWKRFSHRQQPWDGKWHTVTLALEDSGRRPEATERLGELGYTQIDNNQFLGPRNRYEDVIGIFKQSDLKGSIVSVHGELNVNVGLEAFIETTYKLAELRPLYRKFIEKYQPIHEQIKGDSQTEAFVKTGRALPALHQLGFEFFRIASRDAMLPKSLYPDWEGEQAAFLMRDLRAILDDSSWRYLVNYI